MEEKNNWNWDAIMTWTLIFFITWQLWKWIFNVIAGL